MIFENDNRQNPTAGRVLYKNEAEFNKDVKDIITLAQSMGAYLHHDRTAGEMNHIHYRVESNGAFGTDFNVYTYLTDRLKNNYGYYSIMIISDMDSALLLMPPPPMGDRGSNLH
ncbi:hypothetical protein [Treponema sp. R80B11-R83G3]